jgi:hypothetical protein
MYKRFFVQAGEEISNIKAAVNRHKQGKNSIDFGNVNQLSESLTIEELFAKQKRLKRLYDKGELQRRVRNHMDDIWYIPTLAGDEIDRYDKVKDGRYTDAMRAVARAVNRTNK